jgi:cyclophilin family peptidyl-prolyl cis-trans isomerase
MRFITQLQVICCALVALALSGSASQFAAAQNTDPVVLIQTTKGPLYIRVFLSAVPYTARNFIELVDRGFYNGLTFHRVESWCIQGGDPNGNGSGNFVDPNTGQPRFLRLEINRNLRHNAAGVVAMARSRSPDSASCQFYITKSAVPYLDGQYAIFGGVVKGVDTVFRIVPGDRIVRAEIYKSAEHSQGNTGEQAQTQKGGGSPTSDSGF